MNPESHAIGARGMRSLRLKGLDDDRSAMLLLLVFVGSWAVVEGFFGARLQQPYNLMQVVWCRYAAHLSLMFVVWGWRRPARLWSTRRPVFQMSRSMLMLVMPVSFALALQAGERPATVWALFWIAPLLILALARWLLRESVPRWLWIAAALGELAAALSLEPAWPHGFGGVLLALLMALSFSLYVVMTRSLRDEPVQVNLFYTALGPFAALSFFVPGVWVMPGLHDALWLAAIGVLGFFALYALDRACDKAPVSRVAPTLHAHLLCMIAVEWVAAGERPSTHAVAGGAVISIIVLVTWARQTALTRQTETTET